jgi:hypothetical protein
MDGRIPPTRSAIYANQRRGVFIDRAWFGLIECPLWPDSDQIPHRIEMTRCARGDIRDVKTLYRERHSSEPHHHCRRNSCCRLFRADKLNLLIQPAH